MNMRRLIPVLFFCLAGAATAEPVPLPSVTARAIFERTQPSVVKVRTMNAKSQTEHSSGTGFAVDDRGRLLTNYHVVSDFVSEPEKYRLQYEMHDGRKGDLNLLAIDVANDLAVLASDLKQTPLALSITPMTKGERGFSIGFPLNQGITVVEGTFNGLSEDSYNERFHFTGALNDGMSGGPALTTKGQVFGINVAVRRNAQLISFLVPAHFVVPLLERARSAPKVESFAAEALRQGRLYSDAVIAGLLSKPWERQTIGNYSVPGKQHPRMRCIAFSDRNLEKHYDYEHLLCFSRSSISLLDNIDTGDVSFSYSLYRDRSLGAWRFFRFMKEKFPTSASGSRSLKDYTRYSCKDRIVRLKGVRAKAALCVSGYKKDENLYDYSLNLITLQNSREAMEISLNLEAVGQEAGLRYIEHFLENIEWKSATTSK
ncbi:MAG: putative serine protease HhoB precursor [Betaproteobacteria bacterium ADurb.Bin341]|nr:MAG: putative serine protease HhoB precursor [Betaproteobacteria bacterium ADurb.Bin341]